MSPGFLALLTRLGLLYALWAGGASLVLAVGWSVVLWRDRLRTRRDLERQRILLAHVRAHAHMLDAVEMACGVEYPQVGDTAHYVRGLVLGQYEQTVGDFRATLLARYGPLGAGETRGHGDAGIRRQDAKGKRRTRPAAR